MWKIGVALVRSTCSSQRDPLMSFLSLSFGIIYDRNQTLREKTNDCSIKLQPAAWSLKLCLQSCDWWMFSSRHLQDGWAATRCVTLIPRSHEWTSEVSQQPRDRSLTPTFKLPLNLEHVGESGRRSESRTVDRPGHLSGVVTSNCSLNIFLINPTGFYCEMSYRPWIVLQSAHPVGAGVSRLDSVLCCFCLLQALEVSQNLPVEVTLKSSALLLQATPLLILISVSAIVQSFLSALWLTTSASSMSDLVSVSRIQRNLSGIIVPCDQSKPTDSMRHNFHFWMPSLSLYNKKKKK